MLAAALLVTAATLSTIPAASAGTGGGAALGVYKESASPAAVEAFGSWLGRQPAYAHDFLAYDTWDEISDPLWWLRGWQGSPYRMVFSVAMIPRDGSTLASGASGQYDARWDSLARNLVAYGQADAVVRLGWEFNGNWFPWSAYKDPPAFVQYWRRIVQTMRAVPGAKFLFDWAPVMGTSAIDPETVYPGDDVVDLIGLSVFDQSWAPGYQDPVQRWTHIRDLPFGLEWHRAFGAAHGKLLTFPEWANIERPGGHGGGDNPYFIEKMFEWFRDNQEVIAYHLLFDPDPESLTAGFYPAAASRFRELFSSELPPAVENQKPPAAPPAPPLPPAPPAPITAPLVSTSVGGGPTVRLRKPHKRSLASRRRTLTLRAWVKAPRGVRRVTFWIDGRRVCTDRRAPYRCKTRTRRLERRAWHRVRVKVADRAGLRAVDTGRFRIVAPRARAR